MLSAIDLLSSLEVIEREHIVSFTVIVIRKYRHTTDVVTGVNKFIGLVNSK